jgi:hypothetical protein
LLTLNFNELNQKDPKNKKNKKKNATVAYSHHVLHSTTTIEEGDDITAITFFATKPSKKAMVVAIFFFCNKAIEEGDKSYHRLLLFKHKKEGDGSKLPLPSSL